MNLRKPPRLARATKVLFDAIRGAGVPMLVEDRATGPDVDRVAALFESEDFQQRIEGLVERG